MVEATAFQANTIINVFNTVPEAEHFLVPPRTGRLIGSRGPIERHSEPHQLPPDQCLQ